MKKWKQLLMFAVVALALTFAVKTESKAASPVTGLKQVDSSSSWVEFQWNADLEADEYLVEMSQDGGATWVQMGTTYNPSATIYSLSAGSTYKARVTPLLEDVAIADASTALDVVTAPDSSNLTAVQSAATTTNAKIQYSNFSGANYFYVVYNDAVIGASTSSTVSITTKLAPASGYWVRAYVARKSPTGYVATGGYEYMYIQTVSNKINTKNFGVSTIYQNINTYYFTVSSQGSVDGYQMQFVTPKGKVKKTITQSGTSFRIPDFINGNFYMYRVRTYVECAKGNAYSAWSGYKYIGMAKKYSGNVSKKRIKCSWSKVSSASKYIVYMSTKKNSGFKKVKTLSSKKRSITIKKFGKKKLKKGKTYYVKVVAVAKYKKKTVKSSVFYVGTANVPRY